MFLQFNWKKQCFEQNLFKTWHQNKFWHPSSHHGDHYIGQNVALLKLSLIYYRYLQNPCEWERCAFKKSPTIHCLPCAHSWSIKAAVQCKTAKIPRFARTRRWVELFRNTFSDVALALLTFCTLLGSMSCIEKKRIDQMQQTTKNWLLIAATGINSTQKSNRILAVCHCLNLLHQHLKKA